MGARVVTVDEVLGGHAVLDIECLDRVYRNVILGFHVTRGSHDAHLLSKVDVITLSMLGDNLILDWHKNM